MIQPILTARLSAALQPLLSRYVPTQMVVLAAPCECDFSRELFPSSPVLALPEGEENKNINTVCCIWNFLQHNHITRGGLVVNIGGGVTTDMGGFAAATYMRGIDFLNIPTSLLAMVDASLGGKTGIDYCGVKNGVGVFAEPVATLIYPPFLRTLPAAEWLGGFAEMLKHALLAGEDDWKTLLAYDIDSRDIAALTPLIERSIAIKRRFVEADPAEHGLRRALNFGHTVGHALEAMALSEQTSLPAPTYSVPSTPSPVLSTAPTPAPMHGHGYYVLWGMVAELYLSVVRLGFPREPLRQLSRLMLEYYGRPACSCMRYNELIDWMRRDKKNFVPASPATPSAPSSPSSPVPASPASPLPFPFSSPTATMPSAPASSSSVTQNTRTTPITPTSSPAPSINFTLLRKPGEPVIDQVLPSELISEALDYLFSL